MQENIFQDLSKEPEQIKWYRNPFSSLVGLITLPFRIIFYPLRALLGSQIINDASWEERSQKTDLNVDEKDEKGTYKECKKGVYTVKRVDYSISRNSNCSLIIAVNEKNDTNNRKLVINFHGNDVDAQNSQILDAALKAQDLTNDFMAIDYPKKATSSKELVDAGVSAVLRAINAGYRPENITITGHSFGGAWSALVLKEMKNYLKKDEKFEGYVNHKSFTNIGAVAVAQGNNTHEDLNADNNAKIQYQKEGFLSKSINFVGSICGLQFDGKSALNDKKLPVKQMKFYAGNADENVPSEASVAVAIEIENDLSIPTQIKYNNTTHFTYAKSLFKPSKDHKDWTKDKAAPNQKYTQRIFKGECNSAPGKSS